MPLLAGIDLGTSGLKSGLFDLEGRMVAFSRIPYPTSFPESAACEQNAEHWWQACLDTLAEARSQAGAQLLAALCIVGQNPTLVFCDQEGRPTRPAMIWADSRAAAEAAQLASQLGRNVAVSSPAARVVWLRHHDEPAYAQTRLVLQSFDYLLFRLTGQPVAVAAIPGQSPWPDDEVSAAGQVRAKIPWRQCGIGECVGELSKSVAQRTGLRAGLPVIAGTVDSFASWIGAGTIEKGLLLNECGTTSGVALCWDCYVAGEEHGLGCIPHPAGRHWMLGARVSTGTNLLEWFCGAFGVSEDLGRLCRQVEGIPAGSEGLLALPYLMGERATLSDRRVKAGFFGIAPRHGRAHFLRAILESVAFAVRDSVQAIRAAGGEIREVRMGGGGAQSQNWNQIRADVLGLPVAVPMVTESALLGAAIIAAVAAGFYGDISEAVLRMVRIRCQIEPKARAHQAYNGLYEIYRGLAGDLAARSDALDRWQRQQEGREWQPRPKCEP